VAIGQHTERKREQKWMKKREKERESRPKMLPDLAERQREIIRERLSSDMSSASCFTDVLLLIDAPRRPETGLLRTRESKLGEPLQLRCRECEIKHSFVVIFIFIFIFIFDWRSKTLSIKTHLKKLGHLDTFFVFSWILTITEDTN